MQRQRINDVPLTCLVCGDFARGFNFGAIACASCKTFFRRHANKSDIKKQCLNENKCEINTKTRSQCLTCRLTKCFAIGMDPSIIGSHRYTLGTSKTSRKIKKLAEPCTLNLLQNDRSTLSKDDWNVLSNILHAYEATDIISHTKHLLQNQSTLPIKIRSKASTQFDIVKHFYLNIQSFIESTPYHQQLSKQDYEQLIEQNLQVSGAINGMFIVRESQAIDYPAFRAGCDAIYPPYVTADYIKLITQMHPNSVYMKIILMVLVFSTICRIVTFNSSIKISSNSNSLFIFNIQNIFVTVYWKYLLYQHGFRDAVQLLNDLSKFILNIMRNISEQESKQHSELIDTVIVDTTRVPATKD